MKDNPLPTETARHAPAGSTPTGSNAGATRRTVLARAGAFGGAALFGSALSACASGAKRDEDAEPKRMLVLGGTVFLGPAIVDAARAAGWEVTLFNRGKSAPGRFPDLELRTGDRNTDDYASLAEGRWDLVVDTSGYIPGHVTAAIEALGGAEGGRIGHYVFVSTISVYTGPTEEERAAANGDPVVTEDSPVGQLDEETLANYRVIRDVDNSGYGPLKAHCEEAAREALPGMVTVVRPGLIVGPEDRTDRFTYWPVRMAEGGDVLAPGDPDAVAQYVDVRDVGLFCFDRGVARDTGTYNSVGYEPPVTMREMLESCRVEGTEANLVWADDAFLLEQEVQPWMGLPLWIPAGGRNLYSCERALEAGHTFRPIDETARDTLAWATENRGPDHRWRAGISREKEAEVLAALKQR
ncbi:MAG: NAD-dependent epimerase/dehydratase family protein [Planctomycetota bacterium]